MMQIECPYCGLRDEIEFSFGGEAYLTRPDLSVDDVEWTQYLYFRHNLKGLHAERWRHTHGCGQWFNAVRDTATHQFVKSGETADQPPQRRIGEIA